jgi:hypothetical protein
MISREVFCDFTKPNKDYMPVTVAGRSKACTVLAHSEAGIMCSNSTQSMDVWYLCVYVCVCVFLYLCTGRGLATC